MKNISYLLLALSILWFSCKKDNGGDSQDAEHYRPLYEMTQALYDLQNGAIDYSSQGYEIKAALVASLQDVESKQNVESVYHIDSSYAYVTMSSGLQAVFFLIPVDGNDEPMYRGSGGKSSDLLKLLSADCSNEITNKKILTFNTDFSTSYRARQVLKQNEEKYGLEVTEKFKEECTYELVTTMGDYGLVVLNTHGEATGFMLGTKLPVSLKSAASNLDAFAEAFNSNPNRSIADQIMIDKQLGVAVGKHYDPNVPIHNQWGGAADADALDTYISAKQIAKFDFSNTIILGNMCYSGFDNTALLDASNLPILEGFRQANTKTYFGYQQAAKFSMTVNSDFAALMEKRLYEGFFNDNDSTGSVHLNMNGLESYDTLWAQNPNNAIRNFGNLYFRQFFADNYCYESPCIDTLVDSRDGLQIYKTVCIGDQVWMAENLRYSAGGTIGVCYDNNSANCDEYGRLYSITELTNLQISTPTKTVKGLCPEGWHVPSLDEIDTLVDFCGGHTAATDKLLSSTGWPSTYSNQTGFNLKPAGYFTTDFNNSVFGGIGMYGKLWTSSKNSSNWHLAFNYGSPSTSIGQYSNAGGGQAWYFSCRCVKDD